MFEPLKRGWSCKFPVQFLLFFPAIHLLTSLMQASAMARKAGAERLLPSGAVVGPRAFQAEAPRQVGLHAGRPTPTRPTVPTTEASAVAALVEAGPSIERPVEAPNAVAPGLVRGQGRRARPST